MTKTTYILICFISTLGVLTTYAQKQDTIVNTLRKNNSYGLRVGMDLKKLTQTIADKDYQGFEIIGDYRLTKKLYLAAEIGTEKITVEDDPITITTNGGYIKAGIDWNVHKNLIGMRNLVYLGFRYGYANFEQNLDRFSIATQNSFFPTQQIIGTLNEDVLSAHWVEFLLGLKVEVLNNVFLGMSVAVQTKFIEDKPEGFDNLYIPGFGTTNDFSSFSAGFNYFISYYIPLYKKREKKSKQLKKDLKEEEKSLKEEE